MVTARLSGTVWAILGAIILASAATPSSWAQSGPTEEVEALYDQFEDREQKTSDSRLKKQKRQRIKQRSSVSDLGQLAPFEDIAVIQRRFLPKTKRFELSLLGSIATNNAFFNTFGASLRMSYFLSEKYGVELNYSTVQSSRRTITDNLFNIQQINTSSFVDPESYLGLAFKWSPVYGKVSWLEERIVPFDIYFTPGLGLTQTALGKSEITGSLGFGQNFALSKAWAIRWDFNWNFYQATVINQTTTLEETKFHSDLFVSLGVSWYFPEAAYR